MTSRFPPLPYPQSCATFMLVLQKFEVWVRALDLEFRVYRILGVGIKVSVSRASLASI